MDDGGELAKGSQSMDRSPSSLFFLRLQVVAVAVQSSPAPIEEAEERTPVEEEIPKRKPAKEEAEEIPKPAPINGGADDDKPKPKTDGEERKPEVAEQDERKHIEERLAARFDIPLEVE